MVQSIKQNLFLASLFYKAVKKYKSFEKALKYYHFANLAKNGGVIQFRWDRIASEYLDDFYANTGIPAREKEWYYTRGIPTYKTQWYGITKQNYNNYISDFDFYNEVNYQNRKHEIWFENKLNTYLLLSPFKLYMPKHFYYVESGKPYPLDVDKKSNNSIDDIIEMIRVKPIVAKACYGGHGRGFYKLEYSSGSNYYANGHLMDEASLRKLIESFEQYVITEFGIPHSKLKELCGDDAFAVIRTVTVYDEVKGAQITAIVIRLGSKEAGNLTDYDGTIYCGIDLLDGHFFTPISRTGDAEGIIHRHDLQVHPDTKNELEGFILPNFDMLCQLVRNVSEYLSMTPYLVMDIIPTESGFQILEINSHGQVRNVEPWFPFRKNEYNLKAFHTSER